jgi:signal transduction histidine kinase
MLLASLTNRIFLAAALLVIIAIGFTAAFVSTRVTAQAETELQHGLVESGAVVGRQSEALLETFTLLARLIADLPKLKAVVAIGDPPTVQLMAVEYQQMLTRSSLVVVTDRAGRVLAAAGPAVIEPVKAAGLPSVQQAMSGQPAASYLPHPSGILQVLSVPITIGADPAGLAGTLSVGFLLDAALAEDFKGLTGSEIAFSLGGRIRAATLPREAWPSFDRGASPAQVSRVRVGGDDYVRLSRPLPTAPIGAAPPIAGDTEAPVVTVIRSRTEQLRFLGPIQTGIAVTVLATMLLATVLSYGVARTVTSPLAAITTVMREVAVTGDLTRKIPPRNGPWQDEDAHLLASTFNTLTDSIARFEHEAAQRERLSSLGRLSSVVAHEVRNPLMIVKAAARTLRQSEASAEAKLEALQDIDAEIVRLNRIVTEVLDYARPLSFSWQETDPAAICREAAQAVGIAEPGVEIAVEGDAVTGPILTDGDRLRTVLVNVLTNASQAVRAARDKAGSLAPPAGPGVVLRVSPRPGGGIVITVHDQGGGIDPELLPRVFEPYITTRRGGTGLGLAIARNIVEGLGGSMTIRSERPTGTELQIDLPARGRDAGDGPGLARG